jgi:hypothetical protein
VPSGGGAATKPDVVVLDATGAVEVDVVAGEVVAAAVVEGATADVAGSTLAGTTAAVLPFPNIATEVVGTCKARC